MGAETYGKLLSSSQAVGLLAVLAVSGSVALLTLGKQRLWHHVFYTDDNPLDCSDCNIPDPLATETMLESSQQHACSPQKVDDSNPMPPQVLQSPLFPCPDEKAQPVISKKVRFAPDVVEPAGDGRAYRWKKKVIHKMSSKKACVYKQEHHEKLCKNSRNAGSNSLIKEDYQTHKGQTLAMPELPANRKALYNGMQRYRSLMTLDCR